jgi:hypothetical protein
MPPNGISSSDYARVCLYGLLSTHRLHLTLFPFSEPSLRPCRVASPIRASTRIQNFSTGLSFPCRSGPSLSRGPLPACTVRNFGPPGAGTGFESTDAKLCDFEKRSPVASPRSRLHRLGHRNVTIPLKTRWFTPAGLCVSTRKFGAFASRQTSPVAKPRDAFDTHRHPKRLKSGAKARNHGTTPKHVPCS